MIVIPLLAAVIIRAIFVHLDVLKIVLFTPGRILPPLLLQGMYGSMRSGHHRATIRTPRVQLIYLTALIRKGILSERHGGTWAAIVGHVSDLMTLADEGYDCMILVVV
ncbi:hypothetical protein CIHG_03236 [Coccidioides immitis H538.4]|uniref:Uncharacterized protein n=1 Tax=Coccidioides immitis H538.4 TaxID=396776 RepID=A0A0J8RN87_COCIT|nr:hypothetical protein CIHG_03236 [Coccidioides immitis H538.4]